MQLNNLSNNSIKGRGAIVITKLKNTVQEFYLSKIADSSRLKLYSQVKKFVKKENYLKLDDPALRSSVTKIRISSHRLPIETGRYSNKSQENRLCELCNHKIGNEYHCLMECFHPKLTNLRNQFLLDMFQINPDFKYMSRETLFLYILSFHARYFNC